jgi:cobalt-zinc-cadmium efflux system outer membrane protein
MNVPGLELPPSIPSPTDDTLNVSDFANEDPGPPGGLTLDQAILRLVEANNELRTKYHEIPMAQADVLTAGLRENPLLFYDTTRIPYGSYSAARPGSLEHGLSIVYPVDYTGKRKARQAAACAVRRVREAQYQDAVRLEIDNLYSSFVDVLDSRDKLRRAEESVQSLDRLLRVRGQDASDDLEDLLIDRETAAIRLEDERKALRRAKQVLAESLALPPAEADRLEVHGWLRDTYPTVPPGDDLVRLALERRPDVVAHRLGVPHALAEVERARTERLPNAYFLYSPFSYTDRRAPGELDSRSWGIGLFMPLPLYDRNQGNVERARINVGRTQSELSTVERQVITEVQAAAQEYAGTREALERLERHVLPLIQTRRQKARDRYGRGEIDTREYLRSLDDHSATIRHYHELRVRHRRSMLDLNTAVGWRILP